MSLRNVIHFLNIAGDCGWQRDISLHIEHLEYVNELRILYDLVGMVASCTPLGQLEPKMSSTVEMSTSKGCDGVLTSGCMGTTDFNMDIQVPGRVLKEFSTAGNARVSKMQ